MATAIKSIRRALFWSVLLISASRLTAQESDARADIPGFYVVARCAKAQFPSQLPPVDSVLDATLLVAGLRSAGVNRAIVFGLRLGALETTPSVRVLEKKVSASVADAAQRAVEAALRRIPRDRPWAFRLRVEGSELVTTLDWSEVCAGAPPRAEVRTAVRTVPLEEFERMQREIEENQIKRRAMRHRVLVDAQGRVVAVEVARTSGDAQFDAIESEALKQRLFSATKLDGVPVSAWVELPGDHGRPRR